VVRGYYNGLDSVDMAGLANDMVLLLEKDKLYFPLGNETTVTSLSLFCS
jgi:hypothetical protein